MKSQTLLCQNAAHSAQSEWGPKLLFLNSNRKSILTFCKLLMNPFSAAVTIRIRPSRRPTCMLALLNTFPSPNQGRIWTDSRFEVRPKPGICIDLLSLIQNKVNNSDKHYNQKVHPFRATRTPLLLFKTGFTTTALRMQRLKWGAFKHDSNSSFSCCCVCSPNSPYL